MDLLYLNEAVCCFYYLHLFLRLLKKKGNGNYVLTATNVSADNAIITGLYLVAQVDCETTTGKREQKTIQRICGKTGKLLNVESWSEAYGGFAAFNHIYSITFFAYGYVNGLFSVSTPIVVEY